MGEKRLGLFVGVSLLLMVMMAGCGPREERINLTSSTVAGGAPVATSERERSPSATPTPATPTPEPKEQSTPTATPTARPAQATAEQETTATGSATDIPTRTNSPTPRPTRTPTATPTPASFGPPDDGMAVVTFAEHDRTAVLHPGDKLVLTLGDGYRWTLSVSGVEVLVPLANSMLPPGVQAVFEARRHGKALVAAAGQPICGRSQTNCSNTIVTFALVVLVE